MSEVPLIVKKNGQYYEVCKEGVLFLRKLKHQKLRIIFNVQAEQRDLQAFNEGVLGRWELNKLEQSRFQSTGQQMITLHPYGKNITHNRHIIIMNAYLNNPNHPKLLILAYLVASSIFYHNLEPRFSFNTHLTHLLRSFSSILKHTNIDQLNQKIKYKTGFSKNPYLLCIIYASQTSNVKDKQQQVIDEFKEFYRYREGLTQLNEAVDTIIDYFPERSCVHVLTQKASSYEKQKIMGVGNEFESSILGRQLFNFEFTGCSLQSLCFEMCELMNQNQNIDLVSMYDKIITNQKYRVQDQATEIYFTRIQTEIHNSNKTTNSLLPLAQNTLITKHKNIEKEVIQSAMLDAMNCMSLSQFYEIHQCISLKMQQSLTQLKDINNQKGSKYSVECYEALQNLEFLQEEDRCLSAQDTNDIMECIGNKIELYIDECLQLFQDGAHPVCTCLSQLIRKYLQEITNVLVRDIQRHQYSTKTQKIQLASLNYDLKELNNLNDKLHYEYELQASILNDYKHKISQLPSQNESQRQTLLFNYYQQNNNLRIKVDELKQQLQDKYIENQDLLEVLQKYDGFINKGTVKLKFPKQLAQLIKQSSDRISPLHELLEKVKNTQKVYEDLRTQINEERKDLVNEMIADKTKLAQQTSEFKRVIKEKEQLEEVIEEARQAIKVMKNVQQQYKDSISQLETRCGTLSCLLASTQADLQLYKKAISLLVEQNLKGRSESLAKFHKVLHNKQLKDILKEVIKK